MHHFADCWRAILRAAEGVLCLDPPAAASSLEAAAASPADSAAVLVRPDLVADCRAALSAADGVRCLEVDETSPVDSASCDTRAKLHELLRLEQPDTSVLRSIQQFYQSRICACLCYTVTLAL